MPPDYELQLLQDVETRWGSALAMVQRILKVLPAILSVLYNDKQHRYLIPSERETSNMEDLHVLTPFEQATKMISSEKKPTAGRILPLIHIGGRRSPAVACWASDHWVASSNPLRGKFRH